MTVGVVPSSDAQITPSFRNFVAAEVRAQLARRRISGRHLSRLLDESHTWVNRRLSGSTAMDADDLERIATVLGMTPMQILGAGSPSVVNIPAQASALGRATGRKYPVKPTPIKTSPLVGVHLPAPADVSLPVAA